MELKYSYNKDKTEATCLGPVNRDDTGDISIPRQHSGATVIAIGTKAFSGSKVSSVHIPATVTALATMALAYCDNLEKVTFEEDSGLEVVGAFAFSGCPKMKSIKLPDKVRIIEPFALSECTCEIPRRAIVMQPNFDKCQVKGYEPNLPPLPHIEKDSAGNAFRLNPAGDGYIAERILAEGSTITVPDRFNGLPVVALGDFCFSDNTDAWFAMIPASVTSAGYFPFYATDELLSAEYQGSHDANLHMVSCLL